MRASATINATDTTSIVELSASIPAYANGTLQNSRFLQDTDGSALALNADAGGIYRGYRDGTVKLFSTAGDLLATADVSGGYSVKLAMSPSHNRLYVLGEYSDSMNSWTRLTYLTADTGTPIGASLDDSSVVVAGASAIAIAGNSIDDVLAVGIGSAAILLDAFGPNYMADRYCS